MTPDQRRYAWDKVMYDMKRRGPHARLTTKERQSVCDHDYIPIGHGQDKCSKCGRIIDDNGND